jgi:septal ring factor EnvC (AmiA/AmiB activator)
MNSLQKKQMMKTVRVALLAFVAMCAVAVLGTLEKAHAQEQKLKQTQGEQMKVDAAAKASQERVTKTAEKTKTIIDEYRATLRSIENTKVYNEQIEKIDCFAKSRDGFHASSNRRHPKHQQRDLPSYVENDH